MLNSVSWGPGAMRTWWIQQNCLRTGCSFLVIISAVLILQQGLLLCNGKKYFNFICQKVCCNSIKSFFSEAQQKTVPFNVFANILFQSYVVLFNPLKNCEKSQYPKLSSPHPSLGLRSRNRFYSIAISRRGGGLRYPYPPIIMPAPSERWQ